MDPVFCLVNEWLVAYGIAAPAKGELLSCGAQAKYWLTKTSCLMSSASVELTLGRMVDAIGNFVNNSGGSEPTHAVVESRRVREFLEHGCPAAAYSKK